MESIEIIKIRLTGIIGCIDEYTSEPAITVIISYQSFAGIHLSLLPSL